MTKLSLLLKVLEGENNQTLANQLRMFHERALPDLGDNIKCGNSLIGPDFYQQQALLMDDEERLRVNVFDWNAEFPEIMKAGGFDAVIGNPPWGAQYNKEEKEYLRTKFEHVHVRTPESFNYFVDQMWACTGNQGVVGLIIPSSFLNQHEFWKTRKNLVESSSISRVANLGDGVFHKVTASSCVLIFGDFKSNKKPLYLDLRSIDRFSLPQLLLHDQHAQNASQIGRDSEGFILQVRNGLKVIQKCYRWPTLKEVSEDVATGVSSGLDAAFIYKADEAKRLHLETNLLRKLVIGGEINRYYCNPISKKQIIYATRETKIQDYPNCFAALAKYRDKLSKRVETASGLIPWFTLYRPRRSKLFDEPKILIRQTSECIRATVDYEQWYCLKSAIIVQLKPESSIKNEYLLALLNSHLMDFLYNDLVGEQARVFPEVKPVQLFKLPIRLIDMAVSVDKACHDRIVSLVDQMLSLNKRLPEVKTDHEKTALQRQIDAVDRQIDQLVYELYGLTEEEIKIVEGENN